jgi:hypothetical protein
MSHAVLPTGRAQARLEELVGALDVVAVLNGVINLVAWEVDDACDLDCIGPEFWFPCPDSRTTPVRRPWISGRLGWAKQVSTSRARHGDEPPLPLQLMMPVSASPFRGAL